MAKPKWFLQGIAIMSVFLYSGDVGSDFWVGIDLYLRCHYHYAATVFTWILVPGFIYGWVIFFQGGVECYGKAVLKVSKSRKQIVAPWILPKANETHYPFSTQDSELRSFFGRINNIFFSRFTDLL